MRTAARSKAASAKPRTPPTTRAKSTPPARVGQRGAARLLLEGGTRAARRKQALAWADKQGASFLCVDLARATSKYIGETEKNLSRLLALAHASGAVLLFDEADALFGKRTGVKDSHDRYANANSAALLEQLADHKGPVLLASSMRGRLDKAALKRAGFVTKALRAR